MGGEVSFPIRTFRVSRDASKTFPMREKRDDKTTEIGRWVHAVRTALGKTRDEFAELIEADSGSVVKWENGERKHVRTDILKRILGVAPPDLRAKCPVVTDTNIAMSDPRSITGSSGLEGFIAAYKRVLSIEEGEQVRSAQPKVEVRGSTLTVEEWRELAEIILRRPIPRIES
jgi:transcriptional regulator with XRE-family HTH domain